ncbi:CPBP family intramembrane glutamic endopeptidase [Nocardia sp. XZ_19_385]|uniref:CPBP family intramembrane glutamic endopeptidase n=1 Tax=Nocardia sp. XZ_19_385 TaxID=2769488 RepID=UPI001E5C3CE7|nr:CPBP family intramembrane glutamic endopeptidase [Nocardia sp. XZ_19_385]
MPGLRLNLRGRTAANAAFATGYALVFHGAPQWLSARGLRVGLASAGVAAAGYGVALSVPALRAKLIEFADQEPEVSPIEWAAVHIPIGTAYSEELIFRGTLEPLLANTFGPRTGPMLGALTFGLWHIHPARTAGDSVPGTVALTTLGGLAFSWLRRRGGSTTAPFLHHWALNAGGVLAPRLARRFGPVGPAQ